MEYMPEDDSYDFEFFKNNFDFEINPKSFVLSVHSDDLLNDRDYPGLLKF